MLAHKSGLRGSRKGFTIVELLIVIVIIGILALLVINTYSGIQSKARNAKRQSDIKSLQTQIEAFYASNSYYPSRTDMNTASWLSSNMQSLDQEALIDPSNPTQSKTLVASPTAKSYSYAPENTLGASCESSDISCTQYTLAATYEGSVNGSTTVTAKNLD